MSVRNALESLYTDSCNVYESEDYQEGSITKTRREAVYSDVPCRLSYGTSLSGSPSVKQGFMPNIEQTITLFISPDINVPAGSELEVTKNGAVRAYNMSGEPKRYSSHQEICLRLKEEYG